MESEIRATLDVAGYRFSRESACLLVELQLGNEHDKGPTFIRSQDWYIRRRLAAACPWSVWFERLYLTAKYEAWRTAALADLQRQGLIEKLRGSDYPGAPASVWVWNVKLSARDVARALLLILPERMKREHYAEYTGLCTQIKKGAATRERGRIRSMQLRGLAPAPANDKGAA